MKCEGDIKVVEKIESLIKKAPECRLIKDGASSSHSMLGDDTKSAVFCRAYEVYFGAFLFNVRLEYDYRVGRGRVDIYEHNMEKLYEVIPGLEKRLYLLTRIRKSNQRVGSIEEVKDIERLLKGRPCRLIENKYFPGEMPLQRKVFIVHIDGLLFVVEFKYNYEERRAYVGIRERNLELLYELIPDLEREVSLLSLMTGHWDRQALSKLEVARR